MDEAEAWRVLGLQPPSSPRVVRRAYVQLARRVHPDRVAHRGAAHRQRAQELMTRLNLAYELISRAVLPAAESTLGDHLEWIGEEEELELELDPLDDGELGMEDMPTEEEELPLEFASMDDDVELGPPDGVA